MVDTYYDKMDRGLVPRLPGYQGYVARNPTLAPGQYTAAGSSPGGIYGRPGRQPTKLDALLKRTTDLQKQANDANQVRYDEGRRLLGLEDPDEWRKQGFAAPSAYEEHKAWQTQQAAAAAGGGSGFGMGGGTSVAGVGATGGNITPQALASRVQAQQRGIYNSSTALNREAVTNSLAMQDAARANQSQSLQAAQVEESRRRAAAAEADQLQARRLEWIYNRNDQAPNLDRVQQIAATEGQGNTEGMAYPMASGGGGGGGGGYPGSYGSDSTSGQTSAQAAGGVAGIAASYGRPAISSAGRAHLDRVAKDAEMRRQYAQSSGPQDAAWNRLRARRRAGLASAAGGLGSLVNVYGRPATSPDGRWL